MADRPGGDNDDNDPIATGVTAILVTVFVSGIGLAVGVPVVAGSTWVADATGVAATDSLLVPTVVTALVWVPGAAFVFSFGGTVLGKVVRDMPGDTDEVDSDTVTTESGADPVETIAAIRSSSTRGPAPARSRSEILWALVPSVVLVAPVTVLAVGGGSIAWYWWVVAGVGSLTTAVTATGMGPFVGGTGGPWPPRWVVALNYVLGLPLAILSVGWTAQFLGWVTLPTSVTILDATVSLTPVLAIGPPLGFALVYTIVFGAQD